MKLIKKGLAEIHSCCNPNSCLVEAWERRLRSRSRCSPCRAKCSGSRAKCSTQSDPDARRPQHVENPLVGPNARRHGSGFRESSCTGRPKCSTPDILGLGGILPWVTRCAFPALTRGSVRFADLWEIDPRLQRSGDSEITAGMTSVREQGHNKHQGPKNEEAVGMPPTGGEDRMAHFVVRLCSVVRSPKAKVSLLDLPFTASPPR